MTHTSKSAPSARTVYTKTVRAAAHANGLTFADACASLRPARQAPLLGNQTLVLGPFGPSVTIHKAAPYSRARGNPSYNNKVYISAPQVDDGVRELEDEDVYDFNVDFVDTPSLPRPTIQSVSLLDLARPAKKRGPAKEFEIVPRLRNVVAMEDNDDLGSFYLPSTCGGDEDEWERVSDEQALDNRKSYSAVLRGHDT